MVEPIGEGQRLQVLERTEECLQWGEALFGRRFRRIPVLFDLSGTTAGMFKRHGRRCQIRYNPWIFGKYFHENLRDTVPHEVAHYLVHAVYGDRGIKPHGAEWRALMHNFGADPGVTFNLDLRACAGLSGLHRMSSSTPVKRCSSSGSRVALITARSGLTPPCSIR